MGKSRHEVGEGSSTNTVGVDNLEVACKEVSSGSFNKEFGFNLLMIAEELDGDDIQEDTLLLFSNWGAEVSLTDTIGAEDGVTTNTVGEDTLEVALKEFSVNSFDKEFVFNLLILEASFSDSLNNDCEFILQEIIDSSLTVIGGTDEYWWWMFSKSSDDAEDLGSDDLQQDTLLMFSNWGGGVSLPDTIGAEGGVFSTDTVGEDKLEDEDLKYGTDDSFNKEFVFDCELLLKEIGVGGTSVGWWILLSKASDDAEDLGPKDSQPGVVRIVGCVHL